MGKNVIVTDYAWENIEIERQILSKVDAEIVVSSSGEEDELLKLVGDAEGIMTSWAKVTAKVIGAAKKCRIIARYGIGLDNIDVEKATQEGIVVTNVPAYCIEEVSDHAMALILACARKISFYDRAVKKGKWDLLSGNKMQRIRGKTLGLVGFGKIGQAVAAKAKGFGLRVIVTDPAINKEKAQEHSVEAVIFERLLSESDFISLHLPLNKSTNNLFGEKEFKIMKKTSHIINTSRGG